MPYEIIPASEGLAPVVCPDLPGWTAGPVSEAAFLDLVQLTRERYDPSCTSGAEDYATWSAKGGMVQYATNWGHRLGIVIFDKRQSSYEALWVAYFGGPVSRSVLIAVLARWLPDFAPNERILLAAGLGTWQAGVFAEVANMNAVPAEYIPGAAAWVREPSDGG